MTNTRQKDSDSQCVRLGQGGCDWADLGRQIRRAAVQAAACTLFENTNKQQATCPSNDALLRN
ncbi:MAG: hypothetical protein KAV82_02530 [Phycisphaerae bacterium]|nr:hypothetical protein [Phycisphaerae bacterium]